MSKKIYVASSWRNTIQPHIVDLLRKEGHEVYDFKNPPNKSGFGWEQIDKNWQSWTTEQYKEHLNHPLAKEGFDSDFDAMKNAEICVLVMPCGRSAHTEAGYMQGEGKKVFVFIPVISEPELMYKIFSGITDDTKELINFCNS